MTNAEPALVAIGHVSWDTTPATPDVRQPGGAAAYAVVMARRLSIDAALVTAAAATDDDYPFDDVAPPNRRRVRTSSRTTAFDNTEPPGGIRRQRLLARAADLAQSDVPADWRRPDVLFAAPLAQELTPDCRAWFQPRIACAVPQGWCRRWKRPLPADVAVHPSPPPEMSNAWDICVISEHEAHAETLDEWRNVSELLVVTRGPRGATLYRRGETHGIAIAPAAPATPDGSASPPHAVDSTGAGDVFAAAMAIHYARHGDALDAAAFGAQWAAQSITAPSWQGIA